MHLGLKYGLVLKFHRKPNIFRFHSIRDVCNSVFFYFDWNCGARKNEGTLAWHVCVWVCSIQKTSIRLKCSLDQILALFFQQRHLTVASSQALLGWKRFNGLCSHIRTIQIENYMVDEEEVMPEKIVNKIYRQTVSFPS